jgi:hypothetical protein
MFIDHQVMNALLGNPFSARVASANAKRVHEDAFNETRGDEQWMGCP